MDDKSVTSRAPMVRAALEEDEGWRMAREGREEGGMRGRGRPDVAWVVGGEAADRETVCQARQGEAKPS